MSANVMILLVVIIVVALCVVLPYVLKRIMHKGIDAVRNAKIDKENETQPPKTENLADRFKGSK